MSNISDRTLLLRWIFLVGLMLILFSGWRFVKNRANQDNDPRSNSKVVSLNKDQLAMVEFVKKNPELADEFNNLVKILNTVRGQYVQEKQPEDLLKMAAILEYDDAAGGPRVDVNPLVTTLMRRRASEAPRARA